MLIAEDLRCQRVPQPLALAGTPAFSWKLRSAERNQSQTAYRLQAARSAAGLQTPDLWDTGSVPSDRTLDIPWEGPQLPPFSRVYWQVTVRDQDGCETQSAVSSFETGPDPAMFNGKTIFAGEKPDQPVTKTSFPTTAPALDMPAFPGPPPGDGPEGGPDAAPEGPPPEAPDMRPVPKPEYYFRKEFHLEAVPARARLYITASAACLVRVNGAPAGEWLHDPSPNGTALRALYTPYDLGGKLQAGENVLAVSCAGANIAALLFLEAADGTQTLFSTDGSWHWTAGPTLLAGTGEFYDAGKELHGWDRPGCAEDGWQPCGQGPDPVIPMHPNLMPVQRVVWSEHPASMEKTAWGTWRCRSSRLTAGRVRFRLAAPAGTTIFLHLAEKELRNGEILRGTDPLGNPEEGGCDSFIYTFSGSGVEEWAPRYSYAGISWLEIADYPGEIHPEDIWFEAVLNDAPHISQMESSEPLFTQLHNALVATIENNFHGVLTTCPPYEKGPADGDTSVTLPAFLWNLDCLPILERLDDDFAATIRCRISYTEEDLRENRVAPGMIRTVPEWSSMLVHNLRNLKDFCGLQEAAQFYPELQRYFGTELAELHHSDYLVDSFFGGDWNSPDGNGAPEGGTLSGTCYEYYSLQTMAGLCEEAGHPEDAPLYLQEAEKVRDSINTKCLQGDEYRTAKQMYYPAWGPPPWDGADKTPLPVGYRQTSNVLPLAFGIVPADRRQAVLDRLAAEIHKNGDHLNTGFVGAKYLLKTLSDAGYVDLAYEIAAKRDYPSWGWWFEQGATTCREQWGNFSRSYDHYFLAAGPEDWFRECLAGIRDQQDGFRTFTIRPQLPEKLQAFGMASDTARGRVASRWEKQGSSVLLEVEIPVGSTATVELPADAAAIRSDGAAVTEHSFTLGSGTWQFRWERV